LKRNGAPYGEARRLRYFTKICEDLLESPSVDMHFLISKVLESVEKLNPKLKDYIRKTGIMRTRAVTRNYLRFADWLKFVQIDKRLVVPNRYTVFFANLEQRNDFFLTKEEKIGFFSHLINQKEFLNMIASLKLKNSMKNYIRDDLSEHFVESFFEWLVDLDILKPTSHSFGRFNLNLSLGYPVRESCKKTPERLEIVRTYATKLLRTPISNDLDLTNADVWNSFQESLKKLAQNVRSEIDPMLFSAFPIILDLQLQLILKFFVLVPIKRLVKTLKDVTPSYDVIFHWDELANAGYIKIRS